MPNTPANLIKSWFILQHTPHPFCNTLERRILQCNWQLVKWTCLGTPVGPLQRRPHLWSNALTRQQRYVLPTENALCNHPPSTSLPCHIWYWQKRKERPCWICCPTNCRFINESDSGYSVPFPHFEHGACQRPVASSSQLMLHCLIRVAHIPPCIAIPIKHATPKCRTVPIANAVHTLDFLMT